MLALGCGAGADASADDASGVEVADLNPADDEAPATDDAVAPDDAAGDAGLASADLFRTADQSAPAVDLGFDLAGSDAAPGRCVFNGCAFNGGRPFR